MTVGIVGLGLIGGSVGLALREPGRTILGCDPNPDSERIAKERFCVDRIAPIEEVAQADIVFLAAPPAHLVELATQVMAIKGPKTVVTDCGSVKGDLAEWCHATKQTEFVPGHPMAGHEKSGPMFASAWLFRNARWILCPVSSTKAAAVRQVEAVVKLMGANPIKLEAGAHDRHVALLSHLPHVLAGALVRMAEPLESKEVGAGSWRDVTRVAGVDPNLWSQIFLGNRKELAKSLEEFEGLLGEMRRALNEDDSAAVLDFMERAKVAKGETPASAIPAPESKLKSVRRRRP